MKVINLGNCNSGPAPKEWMTDEIKTHRPRKGEVSFQRFDGTNCAQWHFRTAISWHSSGPIFSFK